jgi:hypothetical protein
MESGVHVDTGHSQQSRQSLRQPGKMVEAPSFVAWKVGSYFRPSDLVTWLTVLYGPPEAPGGGNSALAPMLSMPRFRAVLVKMAWLLANAFFTNIRCSLRNRQWKVLKALQSFCRCPP